jgi:hypothetical protein
MSVVTITGDTSICAGSTATLVATGASTYVWNNGASNDTITVNPNSTTTYTVTGTSNGCSNTDSITLTVNPLPNVIITGDTSICAGSTATLVATGASTYVWNNGATNNTITVNPSSNTTYTVTGTSNGCSNTDSVEVTTDLQIVAAIIAPTDIICPSQHVVLTLNPLPPTGVVLQWYLDGIAIEGGNEATLSASVAGTYSLTTSGSSCYFMNDIFSIQYQENCSCYDENTDHFDYNGDDIIITGNVPVTWDSTYTAHPSGTDPSNVNINCKIIVAQGAVFNIEGINCHFGPNGSIVIYRASNINSNNGAKCTIKNAILDGYYQNENGCMWQGIKVHGYSDLQHSQTNLGRQGRLFISQGTQINNAKIAIDVAQVETNIGSISTGKTSTINSKGGGYINCRDSYFNNNYISIRFLKTIHNRSVIFKCGFTSSEALRQPSYVENSQSNTSLRSFQFIQLFDAKLSIGDAVSITKCGFRNTNQPYQSFNQTTAISMSNSNAEVTASLFRSVRNGIRNTQIFSGATNNLIATCNKFENVRQGVLMAGTGSSSLINNNSFTTPLMSNENNAAFGIALDGIGTANIDNNNIQNYQYGIVSMSSRFSYLTNNTIFYEGNVNGSNSTKQYAISITGKHITNFTACNKLFKPSYNHYNAYRRGINIVDNIDFVGSSNASTIALNDDAFGDCDNLKVAGNEFDNQMSTSPLFWAKDVYVGVVGGTPLAGKTYWWAYGGSSWGSSNYFKPQPFIHSNSGLISAECSDVSSIYVTNELFCANKNPVISSDVCPVVYTFDGPNITEASNTNSALSVAEILELMQSTTDSTELQNLQQQYISAMANAQDENGLINYLEGISTQEAIKSLVAIYVGKGMKNQALAKLQLLAEDSTSMERTTFKTYYGLLIDLQFQNRVVEQLQPQEIELLDALKNIEVSTAANAFATLDRIEYHDYEIPCQKLDACQDSSNARIAPSTNYYQLFLNAKNKIDKNGKSYTTQNNTTPQGTIATKLELYPNPSNQYATIEYNAPAQSQVGIRVTDISGKDLYYYPCPSNSYTMQINTSAMRNGMYYVCLMINGKQSNCKKMIVLHNN